MRAPSDRLRDRTFFELLPKRKLLAALSLLVILFAVVYVQRHADRAMAQLHGFFGPASSGSGFIRDGARRVRLAPAPSPGVNSK